MKRKFLVIGCCLLGVSLIVSLCWLTLKDNPAIVSTWSETQKGVE
jgi:hypothetical protein